MCRAAAYLFGSSFDELHFGGFVRNYVKRIYFVDTHPPLGKLLLALVAYLRGYDGEYMWNEVGQSVPTIVAAGRGTLTVLSLQVAQRGKSGRPLRLHAGAFSILRCGPRPHQLPHSPSAWLSFRHWSARLHAYNL